MPTLYALVAFKRIVLLESIKATKLHFEKEPNLAEKQDDRSRPEPIIAVPNVSE